MLTRCSFGVTELAKSAGDEEHGQFPVEKTPHTEVIENTADPKLVQQAQQPPRAREVQI